MAQDILPIPALLDWLEGEGFTASSLEPMAGDVSARCYYRVRLAPGGSAILAVYPAELEPACRRFLSTTVLLQQTGVPVPDIRARDCSRGVMLLSDMGPQTLFDLRHLSWPELEPFLEQAVTLAERISSVPVSAAAALNPRLDAEHLDRELRQTWATFLSPLDLAGDAALTRRLERSLTAICDNLGAETPRPAHRDFMARNLVPLAAAPGLAVLDHQDLRLAPRFYDLASLLNDSLFPPAAIETAIVERRAADHETRLSYHRAAVQRTLKAIGTFAAFARRGFPQHLPLVPATLGRALRHLRVLPEGASLAVDLEPVWGPVIEGPPPSPAHLLD